MSSSIDGTCLETIYRPELSEWPQVLKEQASSTRSSIFTPEERASFRRRMLQAAQEYTLALDALADKEWIKSINPDLPVVATGHQPTIYHMGILEKLRAMTLLRQQMPVTSLQVIIDIDEGTFADLSYPFLTDVEPEVRTCRLSEKNGIAFLQPGLDTEKISQVDDEMQLGLIALKAETITLARAKEAMELYRKYHYLPLRDLNTLIRRLLSYNTQLELPLSHLMADEVLQGFFVNIVSSFQTFHTRYNALLDEHRRERKIKNAANPFPNLKLKDDFYELPLWLFDKKKDKRSPLFVKSENEEFVFSDGTEQIGRCAAAAIPGYISETFAIYPRAVFISIIMRRLVSDLFIHGTGGETYDRFTDTLLSEYFDIDPGQYAIVTATHTLFPDMVREYIRQQSQLEQVHEATSKPEKFFATGLFSAVAEEKLRLLSEQKQASIQELRATGGRGDQASAIKKKLNEVQRDMKDLVVAELTPANPFSQQQAGVYTYRQFPYFLFSHLTT